jgi:hypothetical protein
MRKLRCFTFFIVVFFAFNSQAQSIAEKGGEGHGGDSHVVEFLKMANQICSWSSNEKYKIIPTAESCYKVVSDLQEGLNSNKPKLMFEDNPDLVKENGVQKEALFDSISRTIIISRQHWINKNENEKYTLVGIEISGLIGVHDRYGFGILISDNWYEIRSTICAKKISDVPLSNEVVIYEPSVKLSDTISISGAEVSEVTFVGDWETAQKVCESFSYKFIKPNSDKLFIGVLLKEQRYNGQMKFENGNWTLVTGNHLRIISIICQK